MYDWSNIAATVVTRLKRMQVPSCEPVSEAFERARGTQNTLFHPPALSSATLISRPRSMGFERVEFTRMYPENN